ncbi:sensor histidine kinase [Niveispirillum sp. KHB5.9]|uniref:sensor histidine kinase n=1 Tax=Niveispirillum sp. KHB5.9 TaxID=3400269 RepID=UPI003A8BD15F
MDTLRWLATAPNRAALRVASVFITVSALWIIFSDRAANAMFGDAADLAAFQTAKGLFYVGVTGLILFLLVRLLVGRLADRTAEALRAREAAAETMRQAGIESRALERAKSQFLSSVSHELRTPLNAVIGFADMIGDPSLPLSPDKVRDYAGEIATAGHHLLDLVESIVACAEAETGQPLAPETLDVREEVGRVAGQARVRAQHRRTAVENNVPDGLILRADPLALRQILFALLDNAVTHTPEHSHVRIDGDLDGDGQVVITITDDGPGLPAEVMAGMGRPFLRGGDPLTARVGGLGLGLYLAMLLTARHGGQLSAEQPEGAHGTRIRVAFPAG